MTTAQLCLKSYRNYIYAAEINQIHVISWNNYTNILTRTKQCLRYCYNELVNSSAKACQPYYTKQSVIFTQASVFPPVATFTNGNRSWRPQTETASTKRPLTETATNRNGHKQKRPQTGKATDLKGHKPKSSQTETATDRKGQKPKRP